MERLTERYGDLIRIKGFKTLYGNTERRSAPAANAIVRLAAYEDTLRTPDEIKVLIAASTAPLKLDELRGMDGEPVYCQSLVTGKGEWVICRVVECSNNWFLAFGGGVQAYGDKDTYGEKWLAYCRKPEEGTTHDQEVH